MQDSKNANVALSKARGIAKVKSYEIDSKSKETPLNKTAGRFYFEKFINNFLFDKSLYKEFFCGTSDKAKAREVFAKFVGIINLETNSYCNRKCHYCPMSIVDRGANTQMQSAIFEKILDELGEIGYDSSISLNLYNEPLSDKNIISKIKRIKDKLPKAFLRFNSNGDFLTPKLLDELESSGLNYLNITLHTTKANSYDDKQCIKRLDSFYRRLNLAKPNYTITPNVSITSSHKIGNLTLVLNTSNYDIYGTDRGGALKHLGLQSRNNPCVKIMREFTIDYQGRVFPCCNIFPDLAQSQKFIFGNVSEKSIFEIFSSKQWAKWRKELFIKATKSPCTSCKDGYFDTDSDDKSAKLALLNNLDIYDSKANFATIAQNL